MPTVKKNQISDIAPVSGGEAVTPSDSADLTRPSRLLWVGGAGDLSVIMADGETLAITGVTAGAQLPISVTRVRSTGTDASNIVAFW